MRALSLLKSASRIAVVSFCYCFMTGCSGLDDLSIKNELDFPIIIKQHSSLGKKCEMKTLGSVPANTKVLFDNKGGFSGSGIDSLLIEDGQGVFIEKISSPDKSVTKKDGGCSPTDIWYVTVAPKPQTTPAVANVSLRAK